MAEHVQLGEVRTSYERSGAGDPLVLLHPGGVALRTGLPDAQLAVVPAAGHGLPLDRPEVFTLLVTEFLTMARR